MESALFLDVADNSGLHLFCYILVLVILNNTFTV